MQSEHQKKEIESLEATLASETEKLTALRHLVDRDRQSRPTIKKNTFNNERDAKFYADNLKRMDTESILGDLDGAKVELISSKREQLAELARALAEFDGVEPSNEALRLGIEELKRSRLSLDMSFDDIL